MIWVLLAGSLLLQYSPGLQQHLQLARADLSFHWVTCHLTHWSWDHLLWDGLVVVVVGRELEHREGKGATALLVLVSSLATAGAVLLFEPHLIPYRGLSGIAVALWSYLALRLWSETEVGAWLFFGVAGKICAEALLGETLFASGEGYTVALSAHLGGFLCGTALGVVSGIVLRRTQMEGGPVLPYRRELDRIGRAGGVHRSS